MCAAAVPVKKELLLNGSDYYYRSSVGDIGQKLKTAVYVEFTNAESSRRRLMERSTTVTFAPIPSAISAA